MEYFIHGHPVTPLPSCVGMWATLLEIQDSTKIRDIF